MLVYHITTEERIYNHVEGENHLAARAQFQTVRGNWDDTSKVTVAFRWNKESGRWEKVKAALNW